MAAETDLTQLLHCLAPRLNEGDYVFCSLPDASILEGREVLGSIREVEGLSVILARQDAEALGLRFDYVAAWITLQVHSALQAVGLTAAFSTALAAAGISCNVIAGYHHDHLFVARADAGRALQVLRQLAPRP
ncbi:MAG: ACT domain-containing protein [Pseudomonas sp.]|uniref:ACT domain-containing protein n=1 Tax=Pseudomonas sp. TaxID=306 RepID=UPI003394DCB7